MGSALPSFFEKRVEKLCCPSLPPDSPSVRTGGTGGQGDGKGGAWAGAPEAHGNHLPSSHLVAMMPKAKTTAAKTPIMAP